MSNIPEECHNTLHIRRSVKDLGNIYDVVYTLNYKDTPLNVYKCKMAKDDIFGKKVKIEESEPFMQRYFIEQIKIIDVKYDNTDELPRE